jgi:hypothetical protein
MLGRIIACQYSSTKVQTTVVSHHKNDDQDDDVLQVRQVGT